MVLSIAERVDKQKKIVSAIIDPAICTDFDLGRFEILLDAMRHDSHRVRILSAALMHFLEKTLDEEAKRADETVRK